MEDAVTACSKSTCVKVYLCSNREDSELERRALRESVFPKLQQHCREKLGLDFVVIDPFESSDPRRWLDQQSRQQLLQDCIDGSTGPFLVAIVGQQYGAPGLPDQVEVSEFELLLLACQRAGISTSILEWAYLRDENTIPPSFCYQRNINTGPLSARKDGVQDKKKEEEKDTKMTKDEELRKTLLAAVEQCVQQGLMSAQRAQTYYVSALDADLRFALQHRPAGDISRRCLVYVHKIVNGQGRKDAEPIRTPHEETLMTLLREDFLPGLVSSCQLPVYITTSTCDIRHGYTPFRRRTFAEGLCRQLHADLVDLIDRSVDTADSPEAAESHVDDALARVQAEQEELCGIYAGLYEMSRAEEEVLRAYVEQSKDRERPLVLIGEPCTGKTVTLAHCAKKIKSWLTDRDPVVVIRFSDPSLTSSPKLLLSSLCYQIIHSHRVNQDVDLNLDLNPNTDIDSSSSLDLNHYSHSDHNHPLHAQFSAPYHHCYNPNLPLRSLSKALSSLLLLLPSQTRPLVLLLDGLDQDGSLSRVIPYLPSPLPPHVKLLVSVSSNRIHSLEALKLHYPETSSALSKETFHLPALEHPEGPSPDPLASGGHACVELGPVERRTCVRMLASLLEVSGRRVTSGQQAMVNQALASCPLPLYTRLLHTHAMQWRSDSEVTESSLPSGVHSSISALLDHLEKRHTACMVSRALSYLSLSKVGLTQAELSDLLSSDNEVLAGYIQLDEGPPSRWRISELEVEMLLQGLKGFLGKRTVAGIQVLFWVSRHFKLVVHKRYLSSREARSEVHSAMADYFRGRWAYGRAKPFTVAQNSTGPSILEAVPTTAQMKTCIDRQCPGQPYIFNITGNSPSSSQRKNVNVRKLIELPYHLRESMKWEELVSGLMMSLEFHQAMLHAGLHSELVALLEGEGLSGLTLPRERALLAGVLLASECLLRSSPTKLPMVMEVNLLPCLEAYPELEAYAKEVWRERRNRGCGLGVLLCPAPSTVPSGKCTLGGARDCTVTGAVGTESGVVVATMRDGSAWMWKGPAKETETEELTLHLGEQDKLRFVQVKSSGNCILLFTECNRLILWEISNKPAIVLELDAPLAGDKSEAGQLAHFSIEGFDVLEDTVFVWWKATRFIGMCGVSNSGPMVYLQCQDTVTCVSISADGHFVYCGQEDGTISVLDTGNHSPIATYPKQTGSALIYVNLCKEENQLACVDSSGNIFLWNVAPVKTQPHCPYKQCFNNSNGNNEVVNLDFLEEQNLLLLCQKDRTILWDTCSWEHWDQFLAPKGRSFVKGMLTQDGQFLLALLEASPLVLVWRISSGQCVLSLNSGANSQVLTLLKTGPTVSVVTEHGWVTAWDQDLICSVGFVPKMKSEVRNIVVEPVGERFYVIDGSETVWRWSLPTGRPDGYFLHHGPVEKLCISQSGSHLITLVLKDVYVWQTEAGQNTHRICGSLASNILISPNSKFGVCLSERALSRVWNLVSGVVVCHIHLYLADAQISPESTFLIGLRHGDLLAASLWSGAVSKHFSCSECSQYVVAFHTLPEHPEFVVVMTATGLVFTWKVTEETVCQQFELPVTLSYCPDVFQMSSNGRFALLSTDEDAITVLDLPYARLRSVKAEGSIFKACLDKNGEYVFFISNITLKDNCCSCEMHTKPVLTAVRLTDGGRLGSLCLCKIPLTLVVCGQRCVYVGFQDGSVGVYSIFGAAENRRGGFSERVDPIGKDELYLCETEPLEFLPLSVPNVSWVDLV